ncbi:uncharacterized protein L969DRAFT_53791 [Mixia osmundae IAM 14324]|uniref:Uncharacterized protein n=1 Tax=Mixia osmundae (strain CBS 9802 / IAM 14324 / JCM 22182 / KY 12970) TaxID=764103 RepID=G7DZL4_MIXOS|nr:uncharacterized protein L969DRAFT_53791 [Mixia osmundae IAM 14324]KEI37187.1 hypothetical protein L969DRAFT_53791 [Mixia osmundae IAM 14324]GAA96024.1 hypothetical protein E5Q_02684 [Mixia osmundae IAM 14324]
MLLSHQFALSWTIARRAFSSSPAHALSHHEQSHTKPRDASLCSSSATRPVSAAQRPAQHQILVDLRQLREDFECWASARLHQTDDVVEARLKAGIEEITALERDQAQKDARLRAFVEQVKHAFNSLQY